MRSASVTTTPELVTTHADPLRRDLADFIISARLPEEGRFEQLWARRVDEDRFELCCIPFFLYDIALGDIVATSPAEGRRYVLDRVVRPSGRFVFRAFFEEPQDSLKSVVVAELGALGAGLEWASRSLLAIDTDEPSAGAIADYLQGCEDKEWLVYETGAT